MRRRDVHDAGIFANTESHNDDRFSRAQILTKTSCSMAAPAGLLFTHSVRRSGFYSEKSACSADYQYAELSADRRPWIQCGRTGPGKDGKPFVFLVICMATHAMF